jgi:NADH:ubiquinone oxidoreductase subunit 6 (subunit J)
MGLLAAILLAIWLVGIVVMLVSVVYTFETDDSEQTEKVRLAVDLQPAFMIAVLSILIAAWPATLAYSLATRRK